MRLNELKTFDEVLAKDLRDPEFRAEWERTALARAVANQVISYRAAHDLTQTQFGELVGMTQPAVTRLEAAKHNPSIETLVKLASALKIELNINIVPHKASSKLTNKRARTTDAVSSVTGDDADLLIAATPA